MEIMKKLLIALGLSLLVSLNLFSSDIVIKKSHNSVDVTIEKIKTIVTKKGLHIFAVIDHAKGAHELGMKLLPSKVIIFGNPKMGTLLMQDDASAALDLPMKIAVYKIQNGDVLMAYRNGDSLQKEHSMIQKSKLIHKINGALNKITTKAGM